MDDRLWSLLLHLASLRRENAFPDDEMMFGLVGDDIIVLPSTSPDGLVHRDSSGCLTVGCSLGTEDRALLGLYLPMISAPAGTSYVIAHLGQSIDGCIATASGHADFVTGDADFLHMHRLRALADVVLVGGGTVASDNPKLTTRMVEGPDPVRVVIDRAARLSTDLGVFCDGTAPTLRVVAESLPKDELPVSGETLRVASDEDGIRLPELLASLRERALNVIFVEGGGVTVTRFLEAGLTDRLHITVAPVIVGKGTPGLQLPSARMMTDSLRPACSTHRLGDDVLWDFDMRAGC